jgi:hypothetical protein
MIRCAWSFWPRNSTIKFSTTTHVLTCPRLAIDYVGFVRSSGKSSGANEWAKGRGYGCDVPEIGPRIGEVEGCRESPTLNTTI